MVDFIVGYYASLRAPERPRESALSRHYLNSVARFHQAMCVPRYAGMDRHHQMALVSLRSTLINEEAREAFAALNEYDLDGSDVSWQHLAKELADVLYVTVGTAELLSVSLVDPIVRRVQPPFFSGGCLFKAAGQAMGSLDSLFRLLDIHGARDNRREEIDGIASDLQQLALQTAHAAASYNIPLRQVFDAVHLSNMSKVDPDTGRAIFREDGKLLKSRWYREPDLSFLEKARAA